MTQPNPPQEQANPKTGEGKIEITLNFVEYGTYENPNWNPATDVAARIEILESDKQYHSQEIEVRLRGERARGIYNALCNKLDFMKITL